TSRMIQSARREDPWPEARSQVLLSQSLAPQGNPPVCDHPSSSFSELYSVRDYITGERFSIGFCDACQLHVTVPAPPAELLSRYYPQTYYGSGKRYTGLVEWCLDRLYTYRAARIENGQAIGAVLDVGCGRGLLLDKLRQRGWRVSGTELSEEAAAHARDQLNLPVVAGPLESAHYPNESFDLVILWHVL